MSEYVPATRMLTRKEAAVALRVGLNLVQNLINSGKLRSVMVGRRRFVPADASDELLGVTAEVVA
jgi:excisionase family DNA binding protein